VRICAAQTRPSVGDIDANVRRHVTLIEHAARERADLIFFPELSLTGYEPKLASQLATHQDDARFDALQRVADSGPLIVGAGVPTRGVDGIAIGMIVFQPGCRRTTYCKQQLHPDELAFFVQGDRQVVLDSGGHAVAPAICYESLQESHAERAAELGADVYLASVAKGERNVAKAYAHYPAVARRFGMTVLMANCLGPSDDFVAVGKSAIWNARGEIAAQLDGEHEGLALVDTVTREVVLRYD